MNPLSGISGDRIYEAFESIDLKNKGHQYISIQPIQAGSASGSSQSHELKLQKDRRDFDTELKKVLMPLFKKAVLDEHSSLSLEQKNKVICKFKAIIDRHESKLTSVKSKVVRMYKAAVGLIKPEKAQLEAIIISDEAKAFAEAKEALAIAFKKSDVEVEISKCLAIQIPSAFQNSTRVPLIQQYEFLNSPPGTLFLETSYGKNTVKIKLNNECTFDLDIEPPKNISKNEIAGFVSAKLETFKKDFKFYQSSLVQMKQGEFKIVSLDQNGKKIWESLEKREERSIERQKANDRVTPSEFPLAHTQRFFVRKKDQPDSIREHHYAEPELRSNTNKSISSASLAAIAEASANGVDLLYSESFRANAGHYHQFGPKWSNMQLQQFFYEGLLQFHIGANTGFDGNFSFEEIFNSKDNEINIDHFLGKNREPLFSGAQRLFETLKLTKDIESRDNNNLILLSTVFSMYRPNYENTAQRYDRIKKHEPKLARCLTLMKQHKDLLISLEWLIKEFSHQPLLLKLGGDYQRCRSLIEHKADLRLSDDNVTALEIDGGNLQTMFSNWVADFSCELRDFIANCRKENMPVDLSKFKLTMPALLGHPDYAKYLKHNV